MKIEKFETENQLKKRENKEDLGSNRSKKYRLESELLATMKLRHLQMRPPKGHQQQQHGNKRREEEEPRHLWL